MSRLTNPRAATCRSPRPGSPEARLSCKIRTIFEKAACRGVRTQSTASARLPRLAGRASFKLESRSRSCGIVRDPDDRDKSALHQRSRACPLSEKSVNFSGTCSRADMLQRASTHAALPIGRGFPPPAKQAQQTMQSSQRFGAYSCRSGAIDRNRRSKQHKIKRLDACRAFPRLLRRKPNLATRAAPGESLAVSRIAYLIAYLGAEAAAWTLAKAFSKGLNASFARLV